MTATATARRDDGVYVRTREKIDEVVPYAGDLVPDDPALHHLEPAIPCEADDGLARDAVQEAVGDGRVDLPAAGEEDVGARPFRHLPAPIEHQRIGIARPLGAMLLDRADHV